VTQKEKPAHRRRCPFRRNFGLSIVLCDEKRRIVKNQLTRRTKMGYNIFCFNLQISGAETRRQLPASGIFLLCVDTKMGGVAHVADISAQKAPAQQGTRLSQENEDVQRQKGPGQKARKGPGDSYLLNSRTATDRVRKGPMRPAA
jgi:hypothetical protein